MRAVVHGTAGSPGSFGHLPLVRKGLSKTHSGQIGLARCHALRSEDRRTRQPDAISHLMRGVSSTAEYHVLNIERSSAEDAYLVPGSTATIHA
jgi:hypothetical protein